MQDRHDRDRAESVALGPAFQTSRVMEKLRYKSRNLPDQHIFAIDSTCSIANWDGYAGCPFVISVAGVSGGSLLLLIAVYQL